MNKPMLILLFDGAPSVPRETQMPASSISLIGANPSIRMAAAGQWDTLTPALERKPIWRRHEMENKDTAGSNWRTSNRTNIHHHVQQMQLIFNICPNSLSGLN